jgi:NOL1/NOP2/fmu family ribosome biogenesis protein
LVRTLKGKYKYSHELALSNELIPDAFDRIDLAYKEVIRFLQKKVLSEVPNIESWALISYNKQPLGWVKKVGDRLNNYYPKEFRIRKEFF